MTLYTPILVLCRERGCVCRGVGAACDADRAAPLQPFEDGSLQAALNVPEMPTAHAAGQRFPINTT